MHSMHIRQAAPIVYGGIVALVAVFASGAAAPVAIAGAVVLGVIFTLVKPDPSEDHDRSAARELRAEQRVKR